MSGRTVPARVHLRNLAVAAGLSLLLSACVVYPAGYGYYAGSVGYAPPADVVETVGVAPYPGWVWLGGYWSWVGGRYTWVRGHWSAPRPGYHYERPHWIRSGNGWRMSRGGWRR